MVAEMWKKIKTQWRGLHPVWKGVLLMGALSPLTLIAQFMSQDVPAAEYIQDVVRYYDNALSDSWYIAELILLAPLREELAYRFPAWVALLALLLTAKIITHAKVSKIVWITGLVAIWIFIMVGAYRWALPHDFPLTVFAYGIIWSWVMIATRNIIYPFIFHAASNAIAALAIMSGMHEWLP